MTISQDTKIQKVTADSIIGAITDFNSTVLASAYSKSVYNSSKYPTFTGTATYGITGNLSPASTTTGWTNPSAIPSGQLDNNNNNPQLSGVTDCLTYIPNDIKLELDPLNVTPVGTPTNTAGVVSGFSATNYLTIPSKFNTTDNWELVSKFTTGANFSSIGAIFHKEFTLAVEIDTSGKLYVYNWGTKAKNTSTNALSVNTTYWVRVIINGSTKARSVYYSTDGSTWITVIENQTDSGLQITNTTYPNIVCGRSSYQDTAYFNGSISIPDTKIYKNSSLVWQSGAGRYTTKKGSIVTFPYGVEDLTSTYPVGSTFLNSKFKVVRTIWDGSRFFVQAEVTSDISLHTQFTSDTYVRSLSVSSTGTMSLLYNTESGTGFSGTNSAIYYSTTTNLVQRYNSGTLANYNLSLPIALAKANGSTYFASVHQTFNGMGYIGSTMFVLPGVKGIIPNGSTNINYENPTVALITVGTPGARDLFIKSNNTLVDRYYHNQTTQPTSTHCAWYNPSTNTYKESTSDSTVFTDEKMLFVANFTDDNASPQSKITSITPRPISSSTITASTLWSGMLNLTRTLVKIRKFTSNWYHKTDSTNNLVNSITSYATFNTYYPALSSATLAVNVKGQYWTRSGSTSITLSPSSTLTKNDMATATNINTAINNCYNAWLNTCYNANALTYTFYTCHQNCHSQCHDSRGRR